MSREAMQMALEALEQYTAVVTSVNDPNSWITVADGGKRARDAITALRQALETEREWVGLTEDEIWKCNKAKSGSAVEFHICYAHQNVLDFAEAIEAKLKEKNHG